ncbi:unnamed protein product [Peniophora sp. CBMAI 1063]|nr:unnamed protein product [Peniophora sp. CBMAI 1063]
MSEVRTASLRFTDLPAELVSLVLYWAQLSWHEEHFSAQAPYIGLPYTGLRRYRVPQPASTLLPCCNGKQQDFGGCSCIKLPLGLPSALPSPAYRAAQVSKRLRAVLLEDTNIWQLDNTLYKAVATRSQPEIASDGRSIVDPGARSLIAVDVCTCVLPGVMPFYSSLVRVKLRVPWSSEIRQFLQDQAGRGDSPLRYFDLEALDPNTEQVEVGPRHVMQALESTGLLVSRFSRGNIFYISNTLTNLNLENIDDYMDLDDCLEKGFRAFAGTLEFLTINIRRGFECTQIDSVYDFPRLCYLRLCAHPSSAAVVLAAMVMPHSIDLHFEQSESWRWYCPRRMPNTSHVPFFSAEQIRMRADFVGWNPEDFAQSLAQPERTAIIHADPIAPDLTVGLPSPGEAMWRRSSRVIGLDVRIDPFLEPHQFASTRFPELVSVTFAESVRELRPVLQDPVGRDWKGSLAVHEKTAARRSITFRDSQDVHHDRLQRSQAMFPEALHDTLRYVLGFVPSQRILGSEQHVQEIVFAKDSWLPDQDLGYKSILDRFTKLKALHFDSLPLSPDEPFTHDMEGRLAPVHLDALVLYLDRPAPGGAFPCPNLEIVQLRFPPQTLHSWNIPAWRWDDLMNSSQRIAAGACKIHLTVAVDENLGFH